MKFRSEQLIDQLQSDIRELILKATELRSEEKSFLQLQPGEGKWSVGQVLEHLNSYGVFYIPAIENAMNESTKHSQEWFKPGFFGNYFTNIMQPKEDGTIGMKMPAPKGHRPILTVNIEEVLNEFIRQQQSLLDLLQEARNKNIGAIKVPITISKYIKLKLGDTFRFLIAHERRHFVQIANTLAACKTINAGAYSH